ncbi:MAG: cell wall hydrolase, partial [Lachnospiraceae bacterium]
NTYLLFGEEADKVAPFIGDKTTVVEADTLSVYASADANSAVIAIFNAGDVINAYEEVGDWVLVECESGYGYVSESGISSTYDLATAWTIEEESAYLAEQARIEAERREAERAAAAKLAQAQSTAMGRTTNPAMSVSDSEIYLLACIIEWEAGWEPYEGKLAVANVVLNRVRSPRFSQNTITDVIYAPGQFTGVLDGNGNISERFATLLANGPTHEECYTAAGEALAGVNNIGDYLFFISVKKANYARYTQYTVINNHCFYAY